MSYWVLIVWLAAVVLVYGLLYAVQLPLRKKAKWWISVLSFIVKAILALLAAYISIVTPIPLSKFLNNLFGVLYIVFCSDAVLDLITAVFAAVKKEYKKVQLFVSGLVLSVAYLVYAIVNMMNVVPQYHTYETGKTKQDYTIVFIADLHYGSAQTPDVFIRMLDDVIKEDPDLILLGGDITDEFTTQEQMEYVFGQFGSLDIPVCYVYGNHDCQEMADSYGGRTYSDDQLREALVSNGITVLCDEADYFNDDLVILGRERYSSPARLTVDKLPVITSDKYVICVDHSPYLEDDIKATGADLQLSGHVHGGQFFPLRLIYLFVFNYTYGEYRVGETDLCVSSGVSGWCFPLRTAYNSNFEVIHIVRNG